MYSKNNSLKRTTGRIRAKTGKMTTLKVKLIKPKKQKSISKLMKEADRIFSLKVRHPFPEIEYATCYTCGYSNSYKKLHAGHFLSRYYKAARWHKDNVRPQCYVCNIFKKGDAVKFRQNLVTEIGEARVLAVEKLRDAPIKLSREFLETKIKELSI